MSTTSQPSSILDEWLSDAKIIDDCRGLIHSHSHGMIDLDSGRLSIPASTDYEVVSKAFLSPRFDIGFGECFRAVVAIGGVLSCANGIIKARHCFAIVWYTVDIKVITIDFSSDEN